MAADSQVLPVALLRLKPNANYELVLRWLLGSTGDRLPRVEESFDVVVRLTSTPDIQGDPANDRFLQPNGQFGNAGEPHSITIAPRLYTMIDPPRHEIRVGLKGELIWNVSDLPAQPIDTVCPSGDHMPVGAGFGVYQLLCEAQKSRAEWRATKHLIPEFKRVVHNFRESRSLLREFTAEQSDVLAVLMAQKVAHVLVRHNLRARHLTSLLTHSYQSLLSAGIREDILTHITKDRRYLFAMHPALAAFARGEATAAFVWLNAEIISEVLKLPRVRKILELTVDEPARLREQLRIRSLQGGELMNFWCESNDPTSDPGPSHCPVVNSRGKKFPQSEVIGLGATLGNFPAAELDTWLSASPPLAILVSVACHSAVRAELRGNQHISHDQETAARALLGIRHIGSDEPANDLLYWRTNEDKPFDTGHYRIEPEPRGNRQTSIRLATLSGSSLPPSPPRSAYLNYDLIQSNVSSSKQGAAPDKIDLIPQLDYVTGDGRVEILVEEPDPSNPDRNIAGYNVYAMWEGNYTQTFFSNPGDPGTASLSELAKWRVTRRYSFERDLKAAFPLLLAKLPTSPDGFPNPLSSEPDPAVREIMDPAWQPVILRPESVTDSDDRARQAYKLSFGTEPADQHVAMPLRTERGVTAYALDLRLGMDSGRIDRGDKRFVGWDTKYFVGWDVQYYPPSDTGSPNGQWTPEYSRDGADVTGTLRRPQGYRFWITAVDTFEQESTPVPVATNDLQAGEPTSYVYYPKRRAAIMAPPDNDPASTVVNRGVEIVRASDPGAGDFRLRVFWHTPFLGQVGRFGSAASGERAKRSHISATVILLRRLLRHPVVERSALRSFRTRSAALDDPIFQLPQWRESLERLYSEKWEDTHSWVNVGGGNQPDEDPWEVMWDGLHEDRGYEYMALVGASIANDPTVRAFWTPDVRRTAEPHSGRRVQRIDCDGSDHPQYKTLIEYIDETPLTSEVVSAKAVPVVNRMPARGVTLASGMKFFPAHPVLPPPGVQRDVVLINLLTHPVKDKSAAVPTAEWHTSGVLLTYAQAAMLDTAIARVPNLPSDPSALSIAQKLMAADFTGTSGGPDRLSYRQNMSVGFRGIQDLRFTYTPCNASGRLPAADESEAIRIVVYAVRVPLATASSKTYATCRLRCEFSSKSADVVTYRVVSMTQPTLEGILFGLQPTLARIDPVQSLADRARHVMPSPAGFGDVVHISPTEIAIRLPPGELPATPPNVADVSLYLAQPIFEQDVVDHAKASDYRMFLPAGGGPEEVLCWWVATASAQGAPCGFGRWPLTLQRMKGSIAPASPQSLSVHPPQAGEVLDPLAYRSWVPTGLLDLAQAAREPRLVVAWQYDAGTGEEGIVIERQEKVVEKASTSMRYVTTDVSSWQAIKNIESLSEFESGTTIPAAIQKDWVDAIARDWLLGDMIEIEGSVPELMPLIGFERGLSASNGLLTLTGPNGTRSPGFVDYYETRTDPSLVMDANFEYSYRLFAYLPISDDMALPWNWRYLVSKPTGWSPYQIPEPAPIKVQQESESTNAVSDLGPKIRFIFRSPASQSMRQGNSQGIDEWRYRILVRRKRDFSLRSDVATSHDPGWEDVDSPVSVWPGQVKEVVDTDIERVFPEAELKAVYQFHVCQLHARDENGSRVETLVRGGGEKDSFIYTPDAGQQPRPTLEVSIQPSGHEEQEVERVVTIGLL